MTKSKPFRDSTVLVLGAGASKPYGFPLGPELKQHIVSSDPELVSKALRERGASVDAIQAFKDALRYGNHPTIDIFLERKKNFREMGAMYIAEAISGFESHGALFPERDWYAELYQLLDLNKLERDLPKLSVVTLNYDRSLEHFLTKNVDYNCPHDLVDAAHKRLRDFRIIHAHGSLGDYPNAGYGSSRGNAGSLYTSAERIRIVSDRLDQSPEFMSAQNMLAEAECIVFLGFGYNTTTLNSLLGKVNRAKTQFYGTAIGLDEHQKAAVRSHLNDGVLFGAGNEDCKAFLNLIRK